MLQACILDPDPSHWYFRPVFGIKSITLVLQACIWDPEPSHWWYRPVFWIQIHHRGDTGLYFGSRSITLVPRACIWDPVPSHCCYRPVFWIYICKIPPGWKNVEKMGHCNSPVRYRYRYHRVGIVRYYFSFACFCFVLQNCAYYILINY